MTQLSFRASPVSIDADTTEISACQKMRTDRRLFSFIQQRLARVPALSCRYDLYAYKLLCLLCLLQLQLHAYLHVVYFGYTCSLLRLPAVHVLRLPAVYFSYLWSTMYGFLQSTMATCMLLWLTVCYLARCLQPVFYLACHATQPTAVAFHAAQSVYSMSSYTEVVFIACHVTQQPVMLLDLSIACHATQPVYIACHATCTVYSLSCYLACLQPVMLLALSIACHVTQLVYSLSCYLHCL